METEHIVERDAAGSATRTTIIREGRTASNGSSTLVALLAVLVLAAVAFFTFSQMSEAEVAKDNAVAGAADAVGDAAGAVERGVDSLTE